MREDGVLELLAVDCLEVSLMPAELGEILSKPALNQLNLQMYMTGQRLTYLSANEPDQTRAPRPSEATNTDNS